MTSTNQRKPLFDKSGCSVAETGGLGKLTVSFLNFELPLTHRPSSEPWVIYGAAELFALHRKLAETTVLSHRAAAFIIEGYLEKTAAWVMKIT